MATTDGITGIDVSKWQTTTPRLTGHEFLFARASIGTQRDEMYATHIANARKAGLLVGAYHFNHAPISVASQVAAFLDAAGDVEFYALDVEGRDAFSRAQTAEFIKSVQATGRKCGLYHSLSGFFDAGQDFDWVAYWSDQPPTRSWDFWQWQGSPLDHNRYSGTLEQLQALAGRSAADVTIPISTTTAPGSYDVDLTVGDQLYDQAFAPLVKVSNAQTADGYFVTGTGYIALEVVTGGMRQLVFAKGNDVTIRLKPVPPQDCTDEVAAAIAADRATAKVVWE